MKSETKLDITTMSHEEFIAAMRKRAEIRRQIPTRRSVELGQPDRIADMLEEAARRLEETLTGRSEALAMLERIEGMEPGELSEK